MYRNKKIIFKQEDEQNITVILRYEDFKANGEPGFEVKEKQVGHIHTPSGTGGEYVNAIQVCGISEAFDYWGCGNYGKPKIRQENTFRKYYYDQKGNEIMEQVRDIQLYFDEDTRKCSLSELEDCVRCFNEPCTCDNPRKANMFDEEKGFGTGNPYKLKRAADIKNLEKVEKEELNHGAE